MKETLAQLPLTVEPLYEMFALLQTPFFTLPEGCSVRGT